MPGRRWRQTRADLRRGRCDCNGGRPEPRHAGTRSGRRSRAKFGAADGRSLGGQSHGVIGSVVRHRDPSGQHMLRSRVKPVYAEVARVLRAGGIYISQHKQPTSLQTTLKAQQSGYHVAYQYYRTDPLPASEYPNLIREEGTLEYIHRWEELLGAMCRSGMVIEDMTEPLHAKSDAEISSFAHRARFVAPYIRVKARRVGQAEPGLIYGVD